MRVGTEWIVDASGCNPDILRSVEAISTIFDELIRELSLKPAATPLWKKFPDPGGVTGLVLLSESHLACHTYPEHSTATFNLYCCSDRPAWDWEGHLRLMLGADRVIVRTIERGATVEVRI